MIFHSTIQEEVLKLKAIPNHEDQLHKILELYIDLFPVYDALLLRYSPLGYLGEGIISITSDGIRNIGEIRDDVRSLPVVNMAIQERKAKYYSGIDFFLNNSSKYVLDSGLKSITVTPICFGSVIIGYICSNEFEENVLIDDKLLSSFTLYGKLVGEVILSFHDTGTSVLLSNRELEVMKRISWGESTKEMAESMAISEVTVKQYVKLAMRKLEVPNRTQAVAELFRRGIIS